MDCAEEHTESCISFIRHASFLLNELVEKITGIILGQGDGVDPSVYIGPHDTGVPIITGIYMGKNAESISQMDNECVHRGDKSKKGWECLIKFTKN